MLSKWLNKPKCDRRWPASVRLSAKSGHQAAPLADFSSSHVRSEPDCQESGSRQFRFQEAALKSTRTFDVMPANPMD